MHYDTTETHLRLIKKPLVKHGLLSSCLLWHAKSNFLCDISVLLPVQLGTLVWVCLCQAPLSLALFVSIVAELLSLLSLTITI